MAINLITGDCRTVLPSLPAASVHCVVTSPPYWGLRDYGTAKWEGGDPGCDHVKGTAASKHSTLKNDGRENFGSNNYEHSIVVPFRDQCGHCGAIRIDAQLGLEPDFNAYVAAMVAVFREVRRVLRDDGTLWLNLGDSYATSVNRRSAADTKAAGNDDRTFRDKPFSTVGQVFRAGNPDKNGGRSNRNGVAVSADCLIKPKDLCGIPWRVAFALQADGWYLRQDIIWSKPNPMPESVTDRCTKAHEYLFLLSNRERYYYDAEAIREPYAEISIGRYEYEKQGTAPTALQPGGDVNRRIREKGIQLPNGAGRNKRSVWEVTTQPFSEAHFATFPPALIEPCIKAGCPVGGTVLDPFAGAGTTGLVADRLQRNAILIELSPAYAVMSERRITDDAPLFAAVTT